jgi:hypothetical protein
MTKKGEVHVASLPAERAHEWEPPTGKCEVVARFDKPAYPEHALAAAEMALQPGVQAALGIALYLSQVLGEQDHGSLAALLSQDMQKVWAGDMKQPEAMLLGQAHVLQSIFVNMAFRASLLDDPVPHDPRDAVDAEEPGSVCSSGQHQQRRPAAGEQRSGRAGNGLSHNARAHAQEAHNRENQTIGGVRCRTDGAPSDAPSKLC